MATTKEALRELVERLSEEDARWLTGEEGREPLRDREKALVAAAEAERATGGGEGWATVKRRLHGEASPDPMVFGFTARPDAAWSDGSA